MASSDAAWVDVLPSLARFLPELKKALGNAMPAEGRRAGGEYSQGFTQSAVATVEQASAKLAAARRKEADAAGAVRTAEAKLQDLRESGKAKASQLVAAEEALAKAQRNLDTHTDATAASTRELTAAQERAARAGNELGDSARRADGDLDRVNRRAGLLHGSMGSLKGMIGAAAGAFAAFSVVGFLKESINSLQRIERINTQTATAIESTGGAAQVSAQHIIDMTGELENLTATEAESIQQGANLLLTFTNIRNGAGQGNDIFDQTVSIMTDMTRAMDTTGAATLDTSKTAIQLGKALNDPIKGITALSKVGVSFSEDQKAMIRSMVDAGDTAGAQKIILEELQKEFGGSAEAFAQTTAGKIELAKHALGTFGETITTAVLPTLGNLATKAATAFNAMAEGFASGEVSATGFAGSAQEVGVWLGDLFDKAGELLPTLQDFGRDMVDLGQNVAPLLGGGLGLVVDALNLLGPLLPTIAAGFIGLKVGGLAGSAVGGLGGQLTRLGTAADGSVGKLGKLGGSLSKVGGALPIVGIAVAGFVSVISEQFGRHDEAVRRGTEKFTAYFSSIREGGAAAAAAMEGYEDSFLGKLGVDMEDAPGWEEATRAAREYWNALSPLEQASSKVNEWTNTLSYSLETYGANSEEARTAQERLAYWTDLQTQRQTSLDTAVAAATGTTLSYTGQLEAAAQAAQEADAQTNLLKSALDALTGANVSVDEATSAYYSALDQARTALGDLSGEVVANNGLLNLQSEAGREVQDRLVGLAENSHGYIAAMQTQGATAEELRARDAELRDGFYQTARQLTGNDEAARLLTDRYYGIPDQVLTTVIADTRPAQATIDAFVADLRNGLSFTVPQLGLGYDAVHRAFGGPIPGFSPNKRADNILVAATAGEYMHDVPAVDYYGIGVMEALNRRRIPREQLQFLANGGLVNPFPDPIIQPLGLSPGTASALADYARENGPGGRALSWARSQVGKPYIWGGVGPAGYDCSGFMSAITNILRGHSPHSRVGATASFPWPGFHSGNGMFTIGSTKNAGGGIGHMAGTLMGVNVESRGGEGVVVGPAARGANNALFNTRAALFDDGGLWGPGLGLNLTGGVERVLTPPQDEYFRRFVQVTEHRDQVAPTALAAPVALYTPDIPHAIRALEAHQRQKEALAPTW